MLFCLRTNGKGQTQSEAQTETQIEAQITPEDSPSDQIMAGSPQNDASGSMVTIIAGPKSKSKVFTVERELVVTKSAYFRNQLARSKNQQIELPQTEHEVVEGLVEWFQEGSVGPLAPKPDENKKWTMPKIIQAYRLGKAIRLCGFKNELCDVLRFTFRDLNQYPDPTNLRTSYDHGLRNEPLTKFFMRSLVYQVLKNPGTFANNSENLKGVQDLIDRPEVMKDFIAQVVEFQKNEWRNPNDEYDQEEICIFHDHSDGSSCAMIGDLSDDALPPSYETT